MMWENSRLWHDPLDTHRFGFAYQQDLLTEQKELDGTLIDLHKDMPELFGETSLNKIKEYIVNRFSVAGFEEKEDLWIIIFTDKSILKIRLA